jgi:hypothetical protein
VSAVFRFDERLVKQSGKIINVPVCPQDHITTAPAIAAVRPALGDAMLASEGRGPGAARTGFHVDLNSVYE